MEKSLASLLRNVTGPSRLHYEPHPVRRRGLYPVVLKQATAIVRGHSLVWGYGVQCAYNASNLPTGLYRPL